MKKIQKLLIVPLFVAGVVGIFAAAPQVSAECAGADTSIIQCDEGSSDTIQGTGVWALLLMAINILTGLIGVAALGGIVYGAVLYTSAGGNAEQIKKASTVFTNVVLGVIAYAGMYALLNFLIPGGVFA